MKHILFSILVLFVLQTQAQVHCFDRLSTLTNDEAMISSDYTNESNQVQCQIGFFVNETFINEISFHYATDLYITIVGAENGKTIYLGDFTTQVETLEGLHEYNYGYVRYTHKTLPNNIIIIQGWWHHTTFVFATIDSLLMIDGANNILRLDRPTFVKRL